MSKRIDKKKQKRTAEITASAAGVQENAGRTNLYIQYQDQEYPADEIIDKIRKKCAEEGISEMDEVSVYLKPEEKKAYYTSGGRSGALEI